MALLNVGTALVVACWLLITGCSTQCTDTHACFCFSGFVTCSGLDHFPSRFPIDTTMITISNMVTEEIPANVINTLPILSNVEIHASNISRISSAAFASLSNMEVISLNKVRIGTIEGGAFFNLTNIGVLSIYNSSVDTIEPYAFSDIFAMDEILLFDLNVNSIETFAFSNIDDVYKISFNSNNVTSMQPNTLVDVLNTYEFSMVHNSFGTFGCNSVEKVLQNAHETSFYSNSVRCTCKLSWIIDNAEIKDLLFLNWCTMPNTTESVYWNVLTKDMLSCQDNEDEACPSFSFLGKDASSDVKLTQDNALPNWKSSVPHFQNEMQTDESKDENETEVGPDNAPYKPDSVVIIDKQAELKAVGKVSIRYNNNDYITERNSTNTKAEGNKFVSRTSSNSDIENSNTRHIPSEPMKGVHVNPAFNEPMSDSPASRDIFVDKTMYKDTNNHKETNEETDKAKGQTLDTTSRNADSMVGPETHATGGYYKHAPAEKMSSEDMANGVTNVKCDPIVALALFVSMVSVLRH